MPKRLGGRPSQLQASKIREHILDVAAECFLTQGYGATSIETVAQQARISKRTFYHRFDDKAELFGAVVHRLIERLRPAQTAPLFTGKSLEELLLRLAKIMLQAALSPEVLALHRMVIGEATRFPELAVMMDREGAREEAIRRIAALLEQEAKAGRITLNNVRFAADQFMQMVISTPQRRALGLGAAMTPAELNAWIKNAVDLFLHGCRAKN